MKFSERRLVDKTVLSYLDWVTEFRKEDLAEFGKVLPREQSEYLRLYKMYIAFQNRKDVVEFRGGFVKIKPEDLIIRHMETDRSKGGMWTGQMSQGVTVYHKPTQREVSYDKERSQHKNKHICMVILEDMLTEFKLGDIVICRKGLGEIVDFDLFTVKLKLEDEYYLEYEDMVFHTEEGYNYTKNLHLKEGMDLLEEEFENKRKSLIEKWEGL